MAFVLFFISVLLFILLLKSKNDAKKAQTLSLLEILSKNDKIKALETSKKSLESEVASLKKYEGILDAERKAQEVIAEATRILSEANSESRNIKSQAIMQANAQKVNAEKLFENVSNDAVKIIKQAELKALEIAGDAYYALENTRELERTAKAMKNIISGYGSEYIVPSFSLLDDLAEEFGHTEAGEKLKFARERSKLMVKNGTAGTCEYVETTRRDIAINFVLDAFNGKVDSILSKVKKDNYGILEQKIKDAFQVVNNNGRAFRNAVITQAYLQSRLDELKWAVIAHELKWQEQEEQRKIKEQIREEEKARRDFEKAMREAQKEEETLKKLIERAQKEVTGANLEQRSAMEEKLRELEEKLRIAEDKNQRAISMAQQTKAGNVYIISNIGSFGENVFKIGMTRRLEPLDRVRELGDASVPFDFDVHTLIFSEDAPKLEKELHKKFMLSQMNKVNPRKEFFRLDIAEIKTEIESRGIDAKWTLRAEALQYRESLAIDKTIKEDTEKRLEWERMQLKAEEIMSQIDEEILE